MTTSEQRNEVRTHIHGPLGVLPGYTGLLPEVHSPRMRVRPGRKKSIAAGCEQIWSLSWGNVW